MKKLALQAHVYYGTTHRWNFVTTHILISLIITVRGLVQFEGELRVLFTIVLCFIIVFDNFIVRRTSSASLHATLRLSKI